MDPTRAGLAYLTIGVIIGFGVAFATGASLPTLLGLVPTVGAIALWTSFSDEEAELVLLIFPILAIWLVAAMIASEGGVRLRQRLDA